MPTNAILRLRSRPKKLTSKDKIMKELLERALLNKAYRSAAALEKYSLKAQAFTPWD